ALRCLFQAAPATADVAIISKCPGRLSGSDGKPYPHAFAAARADEMGQAVAAIRAAIAEDHEAVYTVPTVFCRRKATLLSFKSAFAEAYVAIFIDLDVGRTGAEAMNSAQTMTVDHALDEIERLTSMSVIPPPSMVAMSGRGVYLAYVFREAVHATEPNRQQRVAVV